MGGPGVRSTLYLRVLLSGYPISLEVGHANLASHSRPPRLKPWGAQPANTRGDALGTLSKTIGLSETNVYSRCRPHPKDYVRANEYFQNCLNPNQMKNDRRIRLDSH